MDATELMVKARQSDDELEAALQGAVILEGAAGEPGGPAGGACPGFVVMSETSIEPSVLEKLRAIAEEGSDIEVQVLFARAHG